jgi:hypothetical protein
MLHERDGKLLSKTTGESLENYKENRDRFDGWEASSRPTILSKL